MSYNSKNISQQLTARITNKGRNSIAKGNFNISFFQIGDSEYDYTVPFNLLDEQRTLSPFDRESGVKYPYKFDNENSTTTYGDPVLNNQTVTLRNIMGPAGFVSEYVTPTLTEGPSVKCGYNTINITALNGTNVITVSNGNTFSGTDFIYVILGQLGGIDPGNPLILNNNTNGFVYKIVEIVGNNITVDRITPNLTTLTGLIHVIATNCELEYPNSGNISDLCLPAPYDSEGQLNPWEMNVVWSEKPMGFNVISPIEEINDFETSEYVSTKELYGYTTSSGQTFTDFNDVVLEIPTSFVDSFGGLVNVPSEEQRVIAIIHFSELGVINIEPERFFKYDDYISFNDNVDDNILDDLTDREYFQVFIPFIRYHRNTSETVGAVFSMGTEESYIRSTKNIKHKLMFRYLLDEHGNKVGKIFPTNKIIVFDDQELVAVLDHKSNRKYTLPSPKVYATPSGQTPIDSLLNIDNNETLWVTYMVYNQDDEQINGLPCNYFNKVVLDDQDDECKISIPSNLTLIFGDEFKHMVTSLAEFTEGFVGKRLYALLQFTPNGERPQSDMWKIVDITTLIPGHTIGNFIDPINIVGVPFTITKTLYDSAIFFDLSDFVSVNGNFGDVQKFPGSVRLVRASDIEEMNYLVNLPDGQFETTQNPTYVNGNKKITEIALLDDNKEVMVLSKSPIPINRVGTQVFSIKLDF